MYITCLVHMDYTSIGACLFWIIAHPNSWHKICPLPGPCCFNKQYIMMCLSYSFHSCMEEQNGSNREYLVSQIRSMNNRFHSEAKLPCSYDYPLANHIATNKSPANRELLLFSRLCPSFGYLRKLPAKGFKILPINEISPRYLRVWYSKANTFVHRLF